MLDADQGHTVSIMGGNYRIIIGSSQTDGAFAIIEMTVPPGSGPGPHAHAAFQENFYVLEGEVEVKTKEATYTATKGAFVSIPLGRLVHCFKNTSTETAKLLCIVVPAGLDQFFEEIGKPVKPGEFLPPPTMDAEALKRMEDVSAKYGQVLYPPNYLD